MATIGGTTAGTVRAVIPISSDSATPEIPYQIVLRKLTLCYVTGTIAHTSTNKYTFAAYWRNTNTANVVSNYSNLNAGGVQVTHDTGTLPAGANRSYHKGWNVNSLVGSVGNLGCIQMDCTRVGTSTGYAMSGVAIAAFYQLAR